MKRWIKIVLISLGILALIYLLGPRVDQPDIHIPSDFTFSSIAEVEEFVAIKNSRSDIKKGNEDRIVWAYPDKRKTAVVFLYLHGFSASGGEGAPTHEDIAKRYGANLYIPRLHGHGVEVEEPMLDFDGGLYVKSAREAIEAAKVLGDQLIVMGTSTGGTATVLLAAEDESIDALMLFAPNIDLFDPTSDLITGPWGQQLMRLSEGGKYHSWPAPEAAKPYWYDSYRNEAIVRLKALVEVSMTEETFAQIEQPIFVTYHYKSEEDQDGVISVPAIENMLEKVQTPADKIRHIPNPEGGGHVLLSDIFSGNLHRVQNDCFSFLEEVIGLEPMQ